MKRIAKFHKVSENRFIADWKDTFDSSLGEVSEEEAKKIYENIRLPRRATAGVIRPPFFK